MKATKTVLDCQLWSMMDRMKTVAPDLASIPLEDVTGLAEATPDSPSDRVTLKLLVDTGFDQSVENWISAHGGDVFSKGGSVFVAHLPVSQLDQLDNVPGIRRAEGARAMLPRMNTARQETGLETALNNMPNANRLTGDGVVIGIVDTGLDYTHRDFRRDDGNSRLELFAHAQREPGTSISSFNVFTDTEINSALNGNGSLPQGDPQGHGTHCASIAAGNGKALNGEEFRGVAPEAALIAVRSEPLLDTHTIWGIRKTFELAGNRPAVVTLSLGSHMGAHDGTSDIENVIAQESGPGRIIVVAAGNEGSDLIHWQGELHEGATTAIDVRLADHEFQYVDIWVPRGDDVDIEIETPDGARFIPGPSPHTTVFGSFLSTWREDPVNRDQNLTLMIQNGSENKIWRILLHANSVTQGVVHAWSGTKDPSKSSSLFPSQNQTGFSIGMPATEERAISVGSFVSRASIHEAGTGANTPGLVVGQLSPFSSRGPTRMGRQKPDIAAPGQYMTAALATNSDMATRPRYTPRHHVSGDYISIQGTSMATPFVAGVIALMLEREPQLTPEEVQQRLRITAIRDDQTGRVWDDGFGFGRIDVDSLLNYHG